MSAREDERGFQKCDMQVMDPRQANFQDAVNLVERNYEPNGFQLVNPAESGKKNQFDLVELASQIQTVNTISTQSPHYVHKSPPKVQTKST